VIIYLPTLIGIIGLVIFVLASNPKASEIGRLMLGAGLLVTLLEVAQHVLRIAA